MIAGTWSRAYCCVRFRAIALGVALSVTAQAQTAPDPDEGKEALIGRLLHPQPSPWTPDTQKLLALMAEQPVRRLFKSLSGDPQWGPAHRQWRQHFAAFREQYLKLVAPDAALLEQRLAARLRQALSEDEMAELLAVVDDREMQSLLKLATRLGLDLDVAVRTANLDAAPDLYAPDEIAAIRAELVKLQGKDGAMRFVAAKMQALNRKFDRPAFARYQQIMIESLLPIASATIDDADFRARFDAWLGDWRERIRF